MKTLYILIVTGVFSAGLVPAQEPGPERDPFFSAGPRSPGAATPGEEGVWGRDPFSRPFEGTAQPAPVRQVLVPGVKLTGIIYGRDVRLAIIGGEAYREGSDIGDRKLLEIRENSVIFKNKTGGTEELGLADFSMRK